MQRLLFLSITSVLAAGCGDDECGPGGASQTGLTASSADVTLTYGNFTSGANNDCSDASTGIISLTITGTQTGTTTTNYATFCVPRPDQFADGVPIGTGLRIVDFNGEADGCTYAFVGGSVPTGTARATGICENGTHPAGYALVVDGNILLRRTCPTSTDMIAVALSGTVAVQSIDP